MWFGPGRCCLPACLASECGREIVAADGWGQSSRRFSGPSCWPTDAVSPAVRVQGPVLSLDPEGLRLIEHSLLRFQIWLKAYTAWSVGLGVAGLLACLSVGVACWGTGRKHLAGDTRVVRALVVLIALSSLPAACDIGLGRGRLGSSFSATTFSLARRKRRWPGIWPPKAYATAGRIWTSRTSETCGRPFAPYWRTTTRTPSGSRASTAGRYWPFRQFSFS